MFCTVTRCFKNILIIARGNDCYLFKQFHEINSMLSKNSGGHSGGRGAKRGQLPPIILELLNVMHGS